MDVTSAEAVSTLVALYETLLDEGHSRAEAAARVDAIMCAVANDTEEDNGERETADYPR